MHRAKGRAWPSTTTARMLNQGQHVVCALAVAQNNNVHVWFVAHPRQLYDYSTDRPPSLYDISGSAHFYNKADAGIVVHRSAARYTLRSMRLC